MNYGHGGTIRRYAEVSGRGMGEILDFSASINPLGPPEWLRDVIAANLRDIVHYPDTSCRSLIEAVAARYGCQVAEVLPGNGSTEILFLLPRALEAKRALIPVPAYSDYERASAASEIPFVNIPMPSETGFAPDPTIIGRALREGDLVFIGHPVNPSGTTCRAEEIRHLARWHPAAVFVIDEAFLDFVKAGDSLTVNRPENVVVVLSFTKIFAIPGLRLGFAVAAPAVVEKLRRLQPCWTVNSLAQAVGERAAADTAFIEETKKFIALRREELRRGLESVRHLTVFPGEANYLLARIEGGKLNARDLAERLLGEGIAIRVCENFRSLDERYFRVAVKTAEENARLVEALGRASGLERRPRAAAKTPALMFQATGSNAGKSILTAALCRILLQDGFRVAPFKAQNMALNSFVTREGGEMGRAQVVQAQACRLEPEVRMNPVLLKPNTDTGAQVIVNGQPVGNMNVGEYISYKATAFEAVKRAYDSLSSEFDAVVIEGAGSPAEVNLKSHDIVNMTMARYAGATVLLIGDIDKGGVFASFVGTMEVLAEWERKLVAGFVINKFRGEVRLLDEALRYMKHRTGLPVYGVVPHIDRLGLPEEDSVGFKSGGYDAGPPPGEHVEIALIDLPHISNFTDIDPFLAEPDVYLKIVRRADDLGRPDAVIIPGSKNTVGDVALLRRDGLGERIRDLAAADETEVVGLCAGFQILGERIDDPHGLESTSRESVPGLGLLRVANVLEREKTLRRVEAEHVPSGLRVQGYEIHHGQLAPDGDGRAAVTGSDGRVIGLSGDRGRVWGTYLHGIFDNDLFRRWFIDSLRRRKGLAPVGRVVAPYDLDAALDRLARIVRESLDIEALYRLMGLT
jgi:adenosylcobyric acid synthase